MCIGPLLQGEAGLKILLFDNVILMSRLFGGG